MATKVVILEDEALIAVELEDQLRDAGFQVTGTFSSAACALDKLRHQLPDVVVMDIELRDGDCAKVAQLLHTHNVPFVVHSASVATSGLHHPIFLRGEWVEKPCSPVDLIRAIRSSLAIANEVEIPRTARLGQGSRIDRCGSPAFMVPSLALRARHPLLRKVAGFFVHKRNLIFRLWFL